MQIPFAKKLIIVPFIMFHAVTAVADEMSSYFSNLVTLEAHFTQSVFQGSDKSKQNSDGFLVVKSPDKFYLEYTKPYRLIYIADGEKLISYDEDLEQVVIKKQGNLIVNTPAMLLSNPKDLSKSYKIERTTDNGTVWFELLPKHANNNFESVSLAFSANQLVAMEMRDSFGQTTRLKFNKAIKNPDVSQQRFKFTPPDGVDVIGQ